MKFNKGFTLIEILVVICIFSVILGISFYFFSKMGKKEALEKDVAGLVAMIRNARMLSVASKNASVFGTHLEERKAVLFEGESYAPGGANEKILEFSGQVRMSGYSLSLSNPDITFTRLTGNTENSGTVTLSLSDGSASTTITILSTGVVQ